jgi:putative ATP-binding cassette transporter
VKILTILFRYSRRPFILAVLAAIASGLASTGILMLINRILASRNLQADPSLVWAFAVLCLLVPLSRFGSSVLLLHLSQKAVFDLRLQLSNKLLAAPLRRLEEVGSPRLMAALTGDIGSMATALTDFPLLCMNAAVVAGSLAYLGWLSWRVLLVMLLFLGVGVAGYQVPMRWGIARQRLAREEGDVLYHQFRAISEGTKELKLHQPRRRAFLAQLQASSASFRRLNVAARRIFIGSASFGQAFVFIAAGLAILLVPSLMTVNREVITGFVLVLLYLMTPLQAILDTLPDISQASVAIAKVERLGLSLTDKVEDTRPVASPEWREIELAGVTHSYTQELDDRKFTLGPIDLRLRQGELVFVIGGNGSGKTTLMKLIAGLYVPQEGRLLLDGKPVTDDNREEFRQIFSAVFADFFLFKDLLGLDHPDLDLQAHHYLERLELDRKVKVEAGKLSTTDLSQGQRKRLALLTAYLEDRSFYLFDEWAADQDPVYKEVFYRQILPGLRSRGKAVVVICHDDRYFHIADRLVKLENGKVILDQDSVDPSHSRPRSPLSHAWSAAVDA